MNSNKKVLVLNMNPAYDVTIYLKQLKKGQLNRATSSINDVGGKGKNVASILKCFGADVSVLGFVGEENKLTYEKYFINKDINYEFILEEGSIRTNYKIFDDSSSEITEINNDGFSLKRENVNKLIYKLESIINEYGHLVCTGSVPKGISTDIYKDIISMANDKGIKTYLDAEGSLLSKGIQAKPFFIKPNINELYDVSNISKMDKDTVVETGKNILDKGIKKILISMGKEGAYYFRNNMCIYSKGLSVSVKSTVGAGDAMLGAVVWGNIQMFSDENIFKLAIATATDSIAKVGTKDCSPNNVNMLYNKVVLESL